MALRSRGLRRKAYLLCGDWHAADDLVQDTLIAVYTSWPRVARGNNIDAYVSRVLVHKFIDDKRRPWRRQVVTPDVPDRSDPQAAAALDDVERKDGPLAQALSTLPAQQRAVIVLRYTDDLTVDEIARVLDLPSGTAILGAGVVAVAGSTLVHDAGSSAPGGTASSAQPATSSSVAATPSPSLPVGVGGQLKGVTLPDPAPGFPIRRVPDSAPRQVFLDGYANQQYWARSFLLAAKPEITTTDSAGNVGGQPTGPEVTMLVGNFPTQPSATQITGQTVSSHPQVAGVVGTAYTGQEKGVPMVTLAFQVGPFAVHIFGSGGATLDQLVALGNALTGLVVPSASPMPATSTPSVSPVVTVSSGQMIDLGSGNYLAITQSEKCFTLADPPNPPTPECKSLTDGNQAAKSISLQSGSAGAGKPTVMTGIYTGTDASLITVTSGGVTRVATIAKLGANPNSLIYYLVWPTSLPAGAAAHGDVTVEAFDSAGRSLATLGG